MCGEYSYIPGNGDIIQLYDTGCRWRGGSRCTTICSQRNNRILHEYQISADCRWYARLQIRDACDKRGPTLFDVTNPSMDLI